MSKVYQHVEHEASRRATEVIVRGGRFNRKEHAVLRFGDGPASDKLAGQEVARLRGIKAVGTIAYASIYLQREGIGPRKAKPLPGWYIERRGGRLGGEDVWLTAKGEQCATLEGAKNMVRGRPQYRLVMHNGNGGYKPVVVK